jgi:hypothetical protein
MGKPVDMAAIRTKNENVRAIGHMRVNARGDIIDNQNQVVQPASQRVNRVYTKTTAAKTPVADVEQPVVEQAAVSPIHRVEPVAPVHPVAPTKLDPVADLFEELSEAEMELDNDPAFEMPPEAETKAKKK